MSFDLNNLPDDVLFYSNEQFFIFVEQYLGVDESELMKIQGIKNIRALIHIPDVLAVIDLDCDEVNEIKKRVCFNTKNKGFVVKQGIKCGIQDLIETLRKKRNDYEKRSKRSKQSESSIRVTSNNGFNLSSSSEQNTNSSLPITTSTVIMNESSNSNLLMNIDYVQCISDSIRKFCEKKFDDLLLVKDLDYTILSPDSSFDSHTRIKCSCGSTIKTNYREDTSSFQLSAFYKHIRDSRCIMMKMKKKKSEKIIESNEKVVSRRRDVEEEQTDTTSDDEVDEVDDDDLTLDATVVDSDSSTANQTSILSEKKKRSDRFDDSRSTISDKKFKKKRFR